MWTGVSSWSTWCLTRHLWSRRELSLTNKISSKLWSVCVWRKGGYMEKVWGTSRCSKLHYYINEEAWNSVWSQGTVKGMKLLLSNHFSIYACLSSPDNSSFCAPLGCRYQFKTTNCKLGGWVQLKDILLKEIPKKEIALTIFGS